MPFRFGGDAVHVYLTINTGDERLALLLELARTDLLPDGVAWLERLRDA